MGLTRDEEIFKAGAILLGTIILFPRVLHRRLNRITSDHFTSPLQSLLYTKLREMWDAKEEIDILSVKHALLNDEYYSVYFEEFNNDGNEIDLGMYLMILEEAVPTPYNISKYRDILLKEAI